MVPRTGYSLKPDLECIKDGNGNGNSARTQQHLCAKKGSSSLKKQIGPVHDRFGEVDAVSHVGDGPAPRGINHQHEVCGEKS